MPNRYSLDCKIEALDLIDRHAGNTQLVSEMLAIPRRTLFGWRGREAELRRRHRRLMRRHRQRLLSRMRLDLLERGGAILARLDEDSLDDEHLTSAIGALLDNALKIEEVLEGAHEQKKQIINWECKGDAALEAVSSRAGDRARSAGALQGCGVRKTLGQNRAGQDDHAHERDRGGEALLVAVADALDGEPNLA